MSDAIYKNAKKAISQQGSLALTSLLEQNDNGQSLLDLAILNNDYLLVRKIIQQLQPKNDDALRFLLVTLHKDDKNQDNSPLVAAAKLTNPQIFEYLLELNPGYSLETLQAAKAQRKKVRSQERRWGMIVALFNSACPSKSLADAMNLPELVLGLGFTISAAALAAVAIPAGIVGFGALACITFAKYQKLKVEQNIADRGLDAAILQTQLTNFQRKMALYKESVLLTEEMKNEIAAELSDLKIKLIKHNMIKKVSLANKKNAFDFLSPKDKIYRNIATAGDILCTNLGFIGLAGLIVGSVAFSVALPIVVTIISALIVTAVTIFYIKNKGQQSKELVEMRRAEFDSDQRLYKSLKNFMFTQENGFLTAIGLIDEGDSIKNESLRFSFDEVFKKFAKANGRVEPVLNMSIGTAVSRGERRQLKHLISQGIDPLPLGWANSRRETTLLHSAVQAGNLLIIEEMLGRSQASKMRKNKAAWVYVAKTEKEQKQWIEVQEKRMKVIKQYEIWAANCRQMLLVPDKKGNLPLHLAASLKDPTLYYMLLKQGVGYSSEDLKKAFALRKKRILKERGWAVLTAVFDSVCPGSSLKEIFFSVSFVALALSMASVSVGVGVAGVFVFGIVVFANYQKAKIERGITTDLEQIALDNAKITGIQLRLQELQRKVNNAEIYVAEAQKEHDRLMYEKGEIRKIYDRDAFKSKTGSLITRKDQMYASISAVGAFLCAFAGTLGLIELAVTTFAVALTGPVGWGLLIGAAVVGLIAAGVYVHNRQQELNIYAERRQNVQLKKEGMFDTVDALSKEINSTLNIRALQQPLRMRKMLENHKDDHRNCPNKRQRPAGHDFVQPPLKKTKAMRSSIDPEPDSKPSLPSTVL